MNRDRYKTSIAFIDLLFNITIGLAMLFIIAFLLINPIAKKGDIIVNAEFIITMSWPKDSKDDIDLYVMDPAGNIVYFRDKDNGLMHLDRDDLGDKNDQVSTDAGIISFELNEEHLTIRGIVPGDYFVAVHYYSMTTIEDLPYTVTVMKVNPFRELYSITGTLTSRREIQRLPAFSIDKDGSVTEIFRHFKKIVPESGN